MKKILALLFLFCCLSLRAQNIVIATVTITNLPTNGNVITVNGQARTWNATATNFAAQIQSAASIVASSSNLFIAYAISQNANVIAGTNGTTNIVFFKGSPGQAMAVSFDTPYATVTYSTNSITDATYVRVPFSAAGSYEQSNVATGLVAYLSTSSGVGTIPGTSIYLVNFGSLTNTNLWSGSNTFAIVSGTVGYFTNGTFNGSTITNSPEVSATVFDGRGDRLTGVFAQNMGHFTAVVTNFFEMQDTNGNVLFEIAPNFNAINYYNGVQGFTVLSNTAVMYDGGGLRTAWSTSTAGLQLPDITQAPGPFTFAGTNAHSGPETFTGAVSTAGTNILGGVVAFATTNVTTLANGGNQDLPVGTNETVILSGPTGAFTIYGIVSPGINDQEISLVNNTGQSMTLANNSGSESTAGNRINLLTGQTSTGDTTYTNYPGVVTLRYSTAQSRWLVWSHN